MNRQDRTHGELACGAHVKAALLELPIAQEMQRFGVRRNVQGYGTCERKRIVERNETLRGIRPVQRVAIVPATRGRGARTGGTKPCQTELQLSLAGWARDRGAREEIGEKFHGGDAGALHDLNH
jgi:hypothetical protein